MPAEQWGLWHGDYNNVEHPAIEDKQEVLLFYALKCTRMPKVIGPSTIQGLSRQDALRYGLLVTLDQDEIFTKGKGVLGTCANKGSDVMFFVATPPSQAGVTACYRRVRGVHKEDEFETDTLEAVNDCADIEPAKDQQCLVGIPFAIVLSECDFVEEFGREERWFGFGRWAMAFYELYPRNGCIGRSAPFHNEIPGIRTTNPICSKWDTKKPAYGSIILVVDRDPYPFFFK